MHRVFMTWMPGIGIATWALLMLYGHKGGTVSSCRRGNCKPRFTLAAVICHMGMSLRQTYLPELPNIPASAIRVHYLRNLTKDGQSRSGKFCDPTGLARLLRGKVTDDRIPVYPVFRKGGRLPPGLWKQQRHARSLLDLGSETGSERSELGEERPPQRSAGTS